MRAIAGLVLFLTSTAMAGAAGGVSCSVADDEVAMSLDGGITRGMGSALFAFSGKAELRSEDVQEDLRITEFEREHVAQYWLDGDTMKLRLYREREGDATHGYVEVIVETTRNDDDEDHGEYIVAVYDMNDVVDGVVEPVQFTGPVTCSIE